MEPVLGWPFSIEDHHDRGPPRRNLLRQLGRRLLEGNVGRGVRPPAGCSRGCSRCLSIPLESPTPCSEGRSSRASSIEPSRSRVSDSASRHPPLGSGCWIDGPCEVRAIPRTRSRHSVTQGRLKTSFCIPSSIFGSKSAGNSLMEAFCGQRLNDVAIGLGRSPRPHSLCPSRARVSGVGPRAASPVDGRARRRCPGACAPASPLRPGRHRGTPAAAASSALDSSGATANLRRAALAMKCGRYSLSPIRGLQIGCRNIRCLDRSAPVRASSCLWRGKETVAPAGPWSRVHKSLAKSGHTRAAARQGSSVVNPLQWHDTSIDFH